LTRAEGALECGSIAAAFQLRILKKGNLKKSGSDAAALQRLRLLGNNTQVLR
jgi:hypothetical protein